MKFCIDCRHFRPAPAHMDNAQFAECTYRFSDRCDIVTGEQLRPKYTICRNLRLAPPKGVEEGLVCGPEGAFFEAKEFAPVEAA